MHITLDPELEKFVEEKVRAGQYAGPSDVIREALSAFREQQELTPEYDDYLQRELAVGLEQAHRGEYADFDAEKIIAEGRQRLNARQEDQ